MDDKAYLVVGEAGEHDDYSEWNVKMFLDKEKALEFCDRLNAWCKARGVNTRHSYSCTSDIGVPGDDPWFHTDSLTGTTYSVVEVPLCR